MAHSKITLHFGISSSSHFWHILKIKNLEIVYYYSAFCSLKCTKPNLNLSAKNVNLFLREPLLRHAGLEPTSSVFLDSRLRGNDNFQVFNCRSNINREKLPVRVREGIFEDRAFHLAWPQ